MTAFPKMPPFDKKGFTDRLKTGVGNYSVFDQFLNWAKRVDALRENVETVRVGVFGKDGLKEHVDRVDGREAAHYAELKRENAALRAQIENRPFLG